MTSAETSIVIDHAKLPVRNAPPTKIIPAMAKLHKSKRIRGLVIMWVLFGKDQVAQIEKNKNSGRDDRAKHRP